MKGVSMIRVVYKAHAYCVGVPDVMDSCGFECRASVFVTAREIRAAAERHVDKTGHTVLVDVVDRTDYAPMPAAEAARQVTP